jgi:spermidine dehydrogenase
MQRTAPYKLETAAFFDKAAHGKDVLVPGYPGLLPAYVATSAATWQEFMNRTPFSKAVREQMLRLMMDHRDYMPGVALAEKTRRLRGMSYAAFLANYVKVGPEILGFVQNQFGGGILNIGAGPDTFSAWMGYRSHFPGFSGMGLPHLRTSDFVPDDQMGEDVVFPDGNATIARLLVRWLNPKALPGSTMEDAILQRLDYGALDLPENAVRIRLSSTAVNAVHDGAPGKNKSVIVTYVKDGKPLSVRAGTCVMACFNVVIPYICPELPAQQKDALKLAVRKPLVTAQVALNNWRAFAKAGVGFVLSPNSFFHMSILDPGNSLGNAAVAGSPDDPAMFNMLMAPNMPGVGTARDQYRAARAMLMEIDRETYERNTIDQLQRMLGGFGFDAKRDIAGITINRWAHGYACGANELYDSFPDGEEPCLKARKRFGRIAIANSDAAGISMTQAAFDQANRAVRELILDVVRPEFYALNPMRG